LIRRDFLQHALGGMAAALPLSVTPLAHAANTASPAAPGWLDVRRFGATGDGVTIDTPAVNRVIELRLRRVAALSGFPLEPMPATPSASRAMSACTLIMEQRFSPLRCLRKERPPADMILPVHRSRGKHSRTSDTITGPTASSMVMGWRTYPSQAAVSSGAKA